MNPGTNEDVVNHKGYKMGPWNLTSTESHILTSLGPQRESFEKELSELPNLPEMLFDKNTVRIDLVDDTGSCPLASLQFSALEALRKVDCHSVSLTVAAAEEWKKSRENTEDSDSLTVHRPFDWTFTTDYTGTLTGPWQVERTDEKIDMELLKQREKILFFASVNLFEDELGDNGSSQLTVKLRAMPSGFYLLQRFFLRVDHRLLRVIDTRLHWRNGDSHLLREVSRRESPADKIKVGNLGAVEPSEADQYCDLVEEYAERLSVIVPSNQTP